MTKTYQAHTSKHLPFRKLSGHKPTLFWIRRKSWVQCISFLLAASLPTLPLAADGPQAIDLGSAAPFTILAGAAITSTGGGTIDGDVGASPISGSAIGLNAWQVNGTIYAVDSGGPAGSVIDLIRLRDAKGDMMTAFIAAAERTPVPSGPFLNPGSGNIGGMTLAPGLYKFTGTASITGSDLTLTGAAEDVWIFQIASNLEVGNGIHVILAGGARASNVFWQVGTSAVIHTFAVFKGTIIADQAVTIMTSSSMEGRAFAFSSEVVFDGNSLSQSTIWTNSLDNGNGWKFLPWFGHFYDAGDGWKFNLGLGWVYSDSVRSSDIWMWSAGLGWFRTTENLFPYIYSTNDSVWLWYQKETSNPRWFYNTSSGLWENR